MVLMIVSGRSGSGKSVALRALEDMGFYCVDNMPPKLLPKFAELCMQSQNKLARSGSTSGRSRDFCRRQH